MQKTGALPEESATVVEADPMPPDAVPRDEALKMLAVSHHTLADMTKKRELRSWQTPDGRRYFDRAELEAVSSREGERSVLREATALLKQQQSHQQATFEMLLKAAERYGSMTATVIERLLTRNTELEQRMHEYRDAAARNVREETEQAIAMLEAEGDAEKRKAFLKTAELAVPVLLAHITKKGTGNDAAIAAAVRALADDADTVARIREAIPADRRGVVDALISAAQGPGKASNGAVVSGSQPEGDPPRLAE